MNQHLTDAVKFMLRIAGILTLSIAFAHTALADTNSHPKFGDYTVHFSVFNSTFITPEVAQIYKLTRAGNRALINISVTKTTDDITSLGLPAKVTGTAANLIQQQHVLDFQTIDEGNAVYYIADLRHTNEEVMNFAVDVHVESEPKPFTVRFTRKLHTDK